MHPFKLNGNDSDSAKMKCLWTKRLDDYCDGIHVAMELGSNFEHSLVAVVNSLTIDKNYYLKPAGSPEAGEIFINSM